MQRIGLISDTHGFWDEQVATYFQECDEVWHAGDVGNAAVLEALEGLQKPHRGVFGNIDGPEIRRVYPEYLVFEIEGVKVLMIHIGGYPGRYSPRSRALLEEHQPDLFVCGHSHILKVVPDKKRNMLCVNPGALGRHGFHKLRTGLRFGLRSGKIKDMEAIHFGKRAVMVD